MVFLGLLLAAAALTAGIGIALANDGAAALTVFGQDVPGVGAQWQVFLAGAAVAVVFTAGMTIAVMGLTRLLRNRRDLRYLREEHEESMTTLETEKRRLQQELARIRGTIEAGLPDLPDLPARTAGGGARPEGGAAPQPAPAPRRGAGRSGGRRSVDPRAVDPRAVDPRAVDPRAVDPRSGDPRPAAPQAGGQTRQTPLASAAARTNFFDRTD